MKIYKTTFFVCGTFKKITYLLYPCIIKVDLVGRKLFFFCFLEQQFEITKSLHISRESLFKPLRLQLCLSQLVQDSEDEQFRSRLDAALSSFGGGGTVFSVDTATERPRGKLPVMSHNDAWFGNIMFRSDGNVGWGGKEVFICFRQATSA